MLLDPTQLTDNLAQNENTTEEILQLLTLQALNTGDIKLAIWIAQNPATPATALTHLADIPNHTVAKNILQNHSCTPETLQKILKQHPELHTDALTSTGLTNKQIKNIIQTQNKIQLAALAQNPNCDGDDLQTIHDLATTHPDMYHIHNYIATHRECPNNLIEKYSTNPQLNPWLAQNQSCPAEILQKLWKTGDLQTKQNILQNQSCPTKIVISTLTTTILADSDWTYLQTLAAANQSASPAALKTYWDNYHTLNETTKVIQAALQNPNCPTETLQQATQTQYKQQALTGLLKQNLRTAKTLQQNIQTIINTTIQTTPDDEKNQTLETTLNTLSSPVTEQTYPELTPLIDHNTTWENLTNTLSSPVTEQTWKTTKTAIDTKLTKVALTDKWAITAMLIYGAAHITNQKTATIILQELLKLSVITSEKNRHLANIIIKQTLQKLAEVAENKNQVAVITAKTLQQLTELHTKKHSTTIPVKHPQHPHNTPTK